ncbi:endonuclease NucS domain-containing protein [Persicirhabdus sediminis]|uniref:DUF91 domain-containing protein n=1 Tax=Persicirhabdus sediminis TaxID=454144 RepID=A0A8J7SKL7_9BACT|nr:endonuclease NucS domain-containing protein [Persicirhabdus sediminis]MBK1789858.1 DUF91 domain-containing protein [Persicirhabdus sediminis]
MPITNTLWNVSEQPKRLQSTALDSEAQLEGMIVQEPSILSDHWLLIGQQVQTTHGGFIDLLAIDAEGNLVVIELKKDKTPRDVVAQALDYASWIKTLESNDIAEIYDHCRERLNHSAESLDLCFENFFGGKLNEEDLNSSHQIVVVASKLDASTERIVNYLNELDVAINVLFFEVFQHRNERLLSRTWLADPVETSINAKNATSGAREPWNGEYYVSFGESDRRSWAEAVEYGFVSAGGGDWYSKTLKQLAAGDRIWVNIPKCGFVGVGEVTAPAVVASEFGQRSFLSKGDYHREYDDDAKKAEYFVAVNWLMTVPNHEAYRETGFFGNQNTVCKPTAARWAHTVKKLKKHFSIDC